LIKYNSAGQVLWSQSYNSPTNTEDAAFGNHALAVDAAGNAYVVGYNQSGPPLFSYSIFVIKYSASGVQEWVSTYTSPFGVLAFAVTVDVSGNVYVCGRVATSTDLSSTDFLTIKYNSQGVQQWVRTYDGTAHSGDMGELIAVDGLGNVFVSGEATGQHRKGRLTIATGGDIVTIKYNPSGNELWVTTFNDLYNDAPRELLVDAAGNVYVTGENDKPAPPNTDFLFDSDFITIKYNGGGNQKWLARFSGTSGPEISIPQDMVLDGAGNVYVTGGSHTVSSNDGLTIKYNASGIEQWQARYPDMSVNTLLGFNNIALDNVGGLYVSGTVEESGSGKNFKTVKYSGSSGIQSWVATYNGPANGNDDVRAMELFNPPGPEFINAFIYVTGISEGIGTGEDITTIRYSQPIIIGPDASTLEQSGVSQFKLSNYPNPFSGTTQIEYQLPYNAYVSIKVYDITGKWVATLAEGQKSAGIHREFFDIGRLSKGVYTYRMITNSPAGRFEQSKMMYVK